MKLFDEKSADKEANKNTTSTPDYYCGFSIGAEWQASQDEEKLTKLVEALKELLKIEPLVAPGEYFEAWDDAKTEARAALKEIGEEV